MMGSVATLTLTEFLLARIAEDEAVARDAASAEIHTVDHEHMVRWQPARVLAECEAKRRIVDAHPLIADPDRLVPAWTGPTPGVACETCGGNPVDSSSPLEDIGPCPTLCALALPYADHADYREEWKP